MAKKILIIDDSRILRQQVRATLSNAGYDVVEAEDGVVGLATLHERDDISLVLCDVNMPALNGLDVVKQLKAEARFATLPVIMLTTEGQPELLKKAAAAGAKGWIVKPFKPELMLGAIGKLAGPP